MREFGPLVRSIVVRYFRGAFEREDAIQEVWLHAFRNRAALDPTRAADLPGWLGVLARRRCLDLWRRRPDEVLGTEPVLSNDEALPEAALQVAATEAWELQQAVIAFEGRLQPAFREFFRLHFVEGLPDEDVVARLGISRLRGKYLKRVLAERARKDAALLSALGRYHPGGPLAS